MSYAEFRNGAFGSGWYLTLSVTDYVVFGLNDTGFADDNHDDFIVAAFIQESAARRRFPEHCRCSPASWAVASCSADCAIVAKLKQQPDALTR